MASRALPTVHLAEENDRSPSFPRDHYLLVTTSVGVYSWGFDGVTLLFRSSSGGIVAARKASNMLAIADGQVVILHDLDKGLQKRSYKLKGSDVGAPNCLPVARGIDDTVGPDWFTSVLE